MIRINYLRSSKLATCNLNQIDKVRSQILVDCINPSKQDLKVLSEKSKIPIEDLRRALDEDERPSANEFGDFSRITFHAPHLSKKKNYFTVPLSIFLRNNMIIILRNLPIECLENFYLFEDSKKVDILKRDVAFTIYILLSEVNNHFFKVTDDIELDINKIEDKVLKSDSEKVPTEIFKLKKTLIYFHKSLTGNREVITQIEKRFIKEIKGKNLRKFRYLYSDVIQLIDMISTFREIMSSSMEIYLTSVSNNMNEVMKRLTVMASFILVPTLISGIYGMNFTFMPEIHVLNQYGYFYALFLMLLSIVVMYFYFKKKDWL